MQVGDLVRITSEWTMHNPWMELPEDRVKIGLILLVGDNNNCIVLVGDEELVLHNGRLVPF